MNISTLDNLNLNSIGYIYSLNTSENIKRRLLDLGLVRNTCIKPIFISPFSGLKAYEFRGFLLAIRNEDASKIEIYTN